MNWFRNCVAAAAETLTARTVQCRYRRNKSQDNEAALIKEPNKDSEKDVRDQQANKNSKTEKILNEHIFNN